MAVDAPPGGGQGGYQLGFQITPLTSDGALDTSGDFRGGPHPVEKDPLYNMALENRDGGNKMVSAGQYEAAVGRYSELIMQTRSLDNETDVLWTDEGRTAVRQLRAAAYLNLSLCFLKTQQWKHASNTATRALQGDQDPPDPRDDVLTPEKKAKALFRRAQVQRDGFGDYDKAFEDLKRAAEYAPDDKAIQLELQKAQRALAKSVRAADKKLAGFLSGSKKVRDGEGIFDEKLRPSSTSNPLPKPTEPVKMSDGLWVMPEKDTKEAAVEAGMAKMFGDEHGEGKIDYNELGREITELKEEKPEVFAALRQKVQAYMEQEISEQERAGEAAEAEPAAEAPPGTPSAAAPTEGTATDAGVASAPTS